MLSNVIYPSTKSKLTTVTRSCLHNALLYLCHWDSWETLWGLHSGFPLHLSCPGNLFLIMRTVQHVQPHLGFGSRLSEVVGGTFGTGDHRKTCISNRWTGQGTKELW